MAKMFRCVLVLSLVACVIELSVDAQKQTWFNKIAELNQRFRQNITRNLNRLMEMKNNYPTQKYRGTPEKLMTALELRETLENYVRKLESEKDSKPDFRVGMRIA